MAKFVSRNAIVSGVLSSGIAVALTASPTLPATAAAVDTEAATGFAAVDRAKRAGLSEVNKSWAASTVDYDRDGRQDLWIGYHARPAKLWRNMGGGSYKQVATQAWPGVNSHGKQIDRHDCVWADVDRNGLPDAYCSTGRFMSNVVKYGRDNELWLQTRRGHFTDVGTAWGVGDLCGRGRHLTFINANGDRFPDLFVGNDVPREREDPCDKAGDRLSNERSKLFINVGGERFRYAQRMWSYGYGPGTRCAETLDFNGDGWQDLVTCRKFDETPRLYRNMRGRGFVNVSWKHQFGGRVTDIVVADIDRDRDPDLVTAGVRGFGYHLNRNGRIQPGNWIGSPPAEGEGRSVAVGDADGDGDMDVYGTVAQGERTNPDDIVWLNNRLDFAMVAVPPAEGAADEVIAVDRLGDGRATFLVLNGFGRALTGPVQLIQVIRQ